MSVCICVNDVTLTFVEQQPTLKIIFLHLLQYNMEHGAKLSKYMIVHMNGINPNHK